MANPLRGEVDAVIDGRPATLVLTLGALAELESIFGAGDLTALAARFETGRLSAVDLMQVIAAGLRGAGRQVTAADVGAMAIAGGAAGAARLAFALLAAAFGAEAEGPPPQAPVVTAPPPAPPFPGPASPRSA